MTRFLIVFGTFLAASPAMANNGDYAASKIAPEMRKNADAVIRLKETRFEFVSTKDVVETEHWVITVLNENGDDWAAFAGYSDKLQQISSVEGYLYDANGKQLKKIKTKDLQDFSGTGPSELADDSRFKIQSFYYRSYPYTVEYIAETRINHSMFFPKWVPQDHEKLSIEHAEFSVVCPADYQFRYKSLNYAGDPVVTMQKNSRITTWAVNNQAAILREPYGPRWEEVATTVFTAPTDFQMGDYKGNMSDWSAFGKFTYALKSGRDQLPDNVRQDVHRIVAGVDDARERVKLLYQYFQKNTRYISIQLGIGGWQPFDAAFVGKMGYGDCKALSNYMYSLLKEAGIRSEYTLIYAGPNAPDITVEFPSSQFNHVILFVPLQQDTMWLECTDQTMPAGYLSSFTANRHALAVDETGGTIVHTPKYGLSQNVQVRNVKARLSEEGSLDVVSGTAYKAVLQDKVQGLMTHLTRDELKRYLQKELHFATYDINSFEYKELPGVLPEVDEKLDLFVSNYSSATGRRLFIVPNIMTQSGEKLPEEEERKAPIVLRTEKREIDSVEIDIPAGYDQEAVPQGVNLETKFGRYSSSTRITGNKIFYYRVREQYSGTFSASDYVELSNYYAAVFKADHASIVLVKK